MLLHDSNVRKNSWYFARKLFCSLQTTRRSWKASRKAIVNCLRKWRKIIDSILSSRWIPCTLLNHLELLHGYVRNDLYRIDGFYVTVWGYSTIGRKSICWFYVKGSFFSRVWVYLITPARSSAFSFSWFLKSHCYWPLISGLTTRRILRKRSVKVT